MNEIGSAEGTWYVVNENVTFEKNLKVTVNASGNDNYNAKSQTVTVTIKVK